MIDESWSIMHCESKTRTSEQYKTVLLRSFQYILEPRAPAPRVHHILTSTGAGSEASLALRLLSKIVLNKSN